jgi:uncharacterized protein YegP (UPF0339 family)
MKILIKKSMFRQKYHFTVVASNGKVIAVSENYYNLKDLYDTVKLLQKDLSKAEIVNTF